MPWSRGPCEVSGYLEVVAKNEVLGHCGKSNFWWGMAVNASFEEANSGSGREHKLKSQGKTELPHTGCLLYGPPGTPTGTFSSTKL